MVFSTAKNAFREASEAGIFFRSWEFLGFHKKKVRKIMKVLEFVYWNLAWNHMNNFGDADVLLRYIC